MDEIKKECWICKHLQKSIHMKLGDDTLYNIWCKTGKLEDLKKCENFKRKDK